MSTAQDMRSVVTGTGALDERIDLVLQTGDAEWMVRYGDVEVDIEFDADSDRVMISADLGVPPADRRADIYELLMAYALLWRETGGLRAGFSPTDRALSLMGDFGAEGLTPHMLASVIANFSGTVAIWRQAVAAHTEKVDPNEQGFLRV